MNHRHFAPLARTQARSSSTSRIALVLASMAAGCLDRPVASVQPRTQSALSFAAVASRTDKVDLLLVVDNSNSMATNQRNVMEQFGPMIDRLVDPMCVSPTNATPHRCDPANAEDTRQYPAVRDLHVGVISTDLGTAGVNTGLCDDPDVGDDGLLNPIANGPSLTRHLPWNPPPRVGSPMAPADFRPAACGTNAMRFPSFITFCSNEADASCDVAGASASTRNPVEFAEWFKCNAGLFVNGCGFEQPLEAVHRALLRHDASARAGNTSRNAGFLRDDALLAIVVLTDEEDGSVRDCARDEGFSSQNNGTCVDAREVFDRMSPTWPATVSIDQRFYRYAPGSAQDPTFSVDRYYNRAPADAPNRWSRDLLSLKPGHPERIVFAAIAGVPLQVPTREENGQPVTDWNALLGAPSPAGPDDFDHRAVDSSFEGPQGSAGLVSMRRTAVVEGCSHVVPACRQEGSTFNPMNACAPSGTAVGQYQAFPSRRIVELARRFDEAPSCGGQPCRNGIVTSICASNYADAMASIVRKIQSRMPTPCLPRQLDVTVDPSGHDIATCIVREAQPIGVTECDAARGRAPVTDGSADTDAEGRRLCVIQQIPTFASSHATALAPTDPARPGWYYDRRANPTDPSCRQRVRFTNAGEPRSGARVELECVQQVTAPGVVDRDSGAPTR